MIKLHLVFSFLFLVFALKSQGIEPIFSNQYLSDGKFIEYADIMEFNDTIFAIIKVGHFSPNSKEIEHVEIEKRSISGLLYERDTFLIDSCYNCVIKELTLHESCDKINAIGVFESQGNDYIFLSQNTANININNITLYSPIETVSFDSVLIPNINISKYQEETIILFNARNREALNQVVFISINFTTNCDTIQVSSLNVNNLNGSLSAINAVVINNSWYIDDLFTYKLDSLTGWEIVPSWGLATTRFFNNYISIDDDYIVAGDFAGNPHFNGGINIIKVNRQLQILDSIQIFLSPDRLSKIPKNGLLSPPDSHDIFIAGNASISSRFLYPFREESAVAFLGRIDTDLNYYCLDTLQSDGILNINGIKKLKNNITCVYGYELVRDTFQGFIRFYDNSCLLSYQNTLSEVTKEDYALFPNPANKNIHIKDVNFNSENQEYVIVNNVGQIATSGVIQSNSIDISRLKKGVYYLKIKGSHYRYPFIKQ